MCAYTTTRSVSALQHAIGSYAHVRSTEGVNYLRNRRKDETNSYFVSELFPCLTSIRSYCGPLDRCLYSDLFLLNYGSTRHCHFVDKSFMTLTVTPVYNADAVHMSSYLHDMPLILFHLEFDSDIIRVCSLLARRLLGVVRRPGWYCLSTTWACTTYSELRYCCCQRCRRWAIVLLSG